VKSCFHCQFDKGIRFSDAEQFERQDICGVLSWHPESLASTDLLFDSNYNVFTNFDTAQQVRYRVRISTKFGFFLLLLSFLILP
jgi:hypothetical protein